MPVIDTGSSSVIQQFHGEIGTGSVGTPAGADVAYRFNAPEYYLRTENYSGAVTPWPLPSFAIGDDDELATTPWPDAMPANEWRVARVFRLALLGAQPAVFQGTTTIIFGQSGAFLASAVLAGTTTITFGQTGALKAGAAFSATTTVVFGQSGALSAGAKLAASTTITFGQSGALSSGAALAGTTPIVFGATGTLVAGSAGAANFAGVAGIIFGATATFSAGGGAVQGPRGAWISDRKVERARQDRWKRQRQAQEDLRYALRELRAGRDPYQPLVEAKNELELGLLEAPAIDHELLALRAQLQALMLKTRAAGLRQLIATMAAQEAEAADEEEAILVSLLMAA